MTRSLLIFLLSGFFLAAKAQLSDDERKYFTSAEDTLTRYIKLSVKAKTDEEKKMINDAFSKLLDEALNASNSYAYPFDSLKKFRMLLVAPDEELRIITWCLPLADDNYSYFGYIQRMEPLTKKWALHKLEDRPGDMKNPDNTTVSGD